MPGNSSGTWTGESLLSLGSWASQCPLKARYGHCKPGGRVEFLYAEKSVKREVKVLDFVPAVGADTDGVCPYNQQQKNTSKPRSEGTVTVNHCKLVQTSSLPRASCLTLSGPWVCVLSCTFVSLFRPCGAFSSAISFPCRETRGTASPRLSWLITSESFYWTMLHNSLISFHTCDAQNLKILRDLSCSIIYNISKSL